MEQQNLAIDFYKTLGKPPRDKGQAPRTRDWLLGLGTGSSDKGQALEQGTGSLIAENEALVGGRWWEGQSSTGRGISLWGTFQRSNLRLPAVRRR